jgi:phosphatidylserine/phosphatidylglycerophosphate/cardiolipin synthase-like enzyme
MSSIGAVPGKSGNINDPPNPKLKSLFIEEDNPPQPANFSPDNLKAATGNKSSIPSNMFNNTEGLASQPESQTAVKTKAKETKSDSVLNRMNAGLSTPEQARFEQIYNAIGKSFTERLTGQESERALDILLDDKLRKLATDQQKVKLMRVAAYELDHAKKSDPVLFNKLEKGIDNIIEDAKAQGKMSKLVEYLFIEMSNTGVVVANMDDWGAGKITQNPKLLSATNPSQKSSLLYELKFGYTNKEDMQGINRIMKDAVNNGQLKSLMGHWTDGLDMASASMDALYFTMSGNERAEFLQIMSDGIAKENITQDLMYKLYGAKKLYDDIAKLNQAKSLEKQGNKFEAGKIFVGLGNTDAGKKLLTEAAGQDYKNGDYGALAKDYVYHAKGNFKEFFNNALDIAGSAKGNHVTRAISTFVGDRIDEGLKGFPILQSKNILEIKEKREKQLEKISKLPADNRTEQQKQVDHQEFEARIDKLTGTKSVEGNYFKLLLNGDNAGERLLNRIKNANESIYIEVFLFHDDKKGNEIADALIQKANEGKDVRVVIDGPSNLLTDKKVFDKLKASKVKIVANKGSFSDIIGDRGMSAYHRKLYIVDKKYAFTGGINVGDEYLTKGKWHDLLVEVKGPIMSDTLNNFYEHWKYSAGKPSDTLEKAPPPSAFKISQKDNAKDLPSDGSGKVRLITTDPVQGKKQIKTWMTEAIKNAHDRILIQDPYFNDPDIVDALKVAINKGVKVQVIFPNSNDMPIMKHLDDTVLDDLYAEGADSYMYNTDGKESFNHLKATVVDDMVALGSSNKDTRAMNTNQEINYIFDDKKFADFAVDHIFENDKKNSTYAEPTPDNFVKRLIKLGLKEIPSVW